MIDTGLTYLPLGRNPVTLSGGERQRLKLTKAITQNETIFVLTNRLLDYIYQI